MTSAFAVRHRGPVEQQIALGWRRSITLIALGAFTEGGAISNPRGL